ncbi:MAG: DUF6444 domain-containing protein [Candidatus Electrothrix aestuarii]|uniref:DUF6444 domain-containing protein n=1 Tax=Candidatus Electrothrix aestuarii TaxID=3062594 RepID=A0AAU8LVA9_9BACT
MHLSREELLKIDKQFIDSLPGKSAKELCLLALDDLKELHERLGQNSENSSMPPSSNFPWARFDTDAQADEEEPDEEQVEATHIELDDSDEESAEHDENADKSDQQDSPENTDDRPKGNKPGKQPGATGHGRTKNFPYTTPSFTKQAPARLVTLSWTKHATSPLALVIMSLILRWAMPPVRE